MPSSAWTDHVRAYAKEHNMSYKQAMSAAKDSYTKTTKTTKPVKAAKTTKTTATDIETPTDGGFILPLRAPGKFPPKSRKVLETAGPLKVLSLRVERAPISSMSFLRKITLGQIDTLIKKHYDEMFHLSLVINNKYLVEKNQVLNFTIYKRRPQTQSMEVALPAGFNLTINEMLEKTRNAMGDKAFSSYEVVKNNCQRFVSSVLTANGLMTPELDKFINQDVLSVINELPGVYPIVNIITDLAARFNRLIEGEGLPDKHELKKMSMELDDLLKKLKRSKKA